MTVQQLIDELNKVKDKNRIVVMSSDGEGNQYSPLDELDYNNRVYVEERSWRGEVWFKDYTPWMESQGFTEDDAWDGNGGVPCLVLWPVN